MKLQLRIMLAIVILWGSTAMGLVQQSGKPPDVNSLQQEFDKFVKAEISHKWQESYRMFGRQYKNAMSEKNYTRLRNRELGKGYDLVGFRLLSMKEVDPERLPGKWWIISICGRYKSAKGFDYFIADTEAVLEKENWRFSQVAIRSSLDNPPWRCKNETQ